MLFNSFEYLIFLPVVFALYWTLRRSVLWQNMFVVAASYAFYGWWDWRYLILMAGYSAWSFGAGILMERCSPAGKRGVLWCTVAVNLGVLMLYKYYDFFVYNFSKVLGAIGVDADWATLNLVLPVGISFYTFQALGYVADVYSGKVKACRNAPAFFAFLSFFPQLVAGPIERADTLLPQFMRHRWFNYSEAVEGMKLILWGLVKKMVIADNCASAVNYIFGNYEAMSAGNLALGGLFFTFQIYGDFSGYSDIAIGSARLLGIRLNENFHFPFFARNVADVWRRWHISLNQWFRDYVYIPLGGNRKGMRRTIVNILIVFGLSGLWHGAKWTFVAWGVFNGMLVGIFTLGRGCRISIKDADKQYRSDWADQGIGKRSKAWAGIAVTFLLFTLGFTLFRCDNMHIAADYFSRLFGLAAGSMPPYEHTIMLLIYMSVFILVEYLNRNRKFGFDFPAKGVLRHRAIRWLLYWITAMGAFLLAGNSVNFIYFQF